MVEELERRMALHEHARVQWHFQPPAEVLDSLCLVLAAAIREKDKRDVLLL